MYSRSFPQYLSSPIQVLWFESDELVIFVFGLVMGIVYGGLAWLFLPAGPFLYSRTKKNNPRGYFFHLLYMLSLIRMGHYPDYFEKEFHE